MTQRFKYFQLNDEIFLSSSVLENLYILFEKFVQKYELQATIFIMFNYNSDVEDILMNLMIEQFRY